MTDPLRELRDVWRARASLPPGFETGALEDCDDATRAAVEWLRAAHIARSDRPAPASVPLTVQLAHARARRRSPRRTAPIAGGLAAAAALLVLARTLVVAPGSGADPVHVADVAAPSTATATAAIEIPPERFRSRDDGIELVSGNVRFVLVTPTTPNPDRGERR